MSRIANEEVLQLAKKLKSREITKEQLFSNLQKLVGDRNQGSETAKKAPDTYTSLHASNGRAQKESTSPVGSVPEQNHEQATASKPPSRSVMSEEQRRLLVQRLVDQKKAWLAPQSKKPREPEEQNDGRVGAQSSRMEGYANRDSENERQRTLQEFVEGGNKKDKEPAPQTRQSSKDSNTRSEPPRLPQPAELEHYRARDVDTESLGSARSYSSNTSLGLRPRSQGSFVERSSRWKLEREARLQAELEKKVRDQIIEEMGLPFRPQVNPRSKEILQNSKFQRTPATGDIPRSAKELIWENLKRRKEEHEVKSTCTFRPATNSVRNQSVQPRYKQKGNPSTKKNGWTDENCSFAPKTNPVKKDMESAQLYLEVPAFERLSRSRTSEDLSSLATKPSSRPSSQKRPRSSSVGSLSSILSNSMNMNKSFEEFLERQQSHIARTEENKKFMQYVLQPPHQPSLCRRSLELSKDKGHFLQRLEVDMKKKEEKTAFAKLDQVLEESKNVRHPQILPTSRQMRRRSWAEMSTGDHLKKVVMQELAKVKVTQEKEKELTFKPATNKNPKAKTKIKVFENPQEYVESLREKEREKLLKKAELDRLRALKEVEHCTFQPQIRDAPEYVKRVARSMALKRKPPPKPTRPQWR